MADKMKWYGVAIVGGLVGVAVWQFLRETARAARHANRKREPWEMV